MSADEPVRGDGRRGARSNFARQRGILKVITPVLMFSPMPPRRRLVQRELSIFAQNEPGMSPALPGNLVSKSKERAWPKGSDGRSGGVGSRPDRRLARRVAGEAPLLRSTSRDAPKTRCESSPRTLANTARQYLAPISRKPVHLRRKLRYEIKCRSGDQPPTPRTHHSAGPIPKTQ